MSLQRDDRAPSSAPLPVALVGAGRWGALHASKLAVLPEFAVVAVVDPLLDRAHALAQRFSGARALPDVSALSELPSRPAAALVATSIGQLASVTQALLDQRLHVLVEKPCAQTSAEAARNRDAALAVGRVLAVGFVERFNPALLELRGAHRRLATRRVGPHRLGQGRLELDWLIHDLDLARLLLGPGLQVRSARWLAVEGEGIVVRLGSDDGRAAQLCVARGRPRTSRRLCLDGQRIDLCAPQPNDALTAQWMAFGAAIRGMRDPRLALGTEGVEALELAEAVARAVSRRSDRPVHRAAG